MITERPGWTAPVLIASTLTAAAGVPATLLNDLRRINGEQWRLEDLARSAASVEEVAAAKRLIDVSNRRRHGAINAIDERVVNDVSDLRNARPYSETVGELCDRLLILDLKCRALRVAGPARLAMLTSTCEHLADVAALLALDIRAGRALLPPRVGFKVYNSAAETDTEE